MFASWEESCHAWESVKLKIIKPQQQTANKNYHNNLNSPEDSTNEFQQNLHSVPLGGWSTPLWSWTCCSFSLTETLVLDHSLFEVFLTDRTQCAFLDGSSSDMPVFSSVPQGTVLGPFLFLIYMYQRFFNLNTYVTFPPTLLMTLLLGAVKTADDCRLLKVDLNDLQDWEHTWKIYFSSNKCKLLHLSLSHKLTYHTQTLNSTWLESTDTHKYLGVYLSTNIKTTQTINRLVTQTVTNIKLTISTLMHINMEGGEQN